MHILAAANIKGVQDARYPNVLINIRVGCCVDFPQWLQQDLVDVAFSLMDEYKEPQLKEHILFNGRTIFIAPPDHKLAALKVLALMVFHRGKWLSPPLAALESLVLAKMK